jgi:hypothetical protein
VPPWWNQSGADPGNTRFATFSATTFENPVLLDVGDPGSSSPVQARDGTIYLSIFGSGSGTVVSHVVQVKPNPWRVTATSADFVGQATTPAIDSDGNVYVVVDSLDDPVRDNVIGRQSVLAKLDTSLAHVWSSSDGGWNFPFYSMPGVASPPKLLEFGGKIHVFVSSRMNGGSRLLVVDGSDGSVGAIPDCPSPVEGGSFWAQPTPAGFTLPYSEDPSPALIVDGDVPYLVNATQGCGITFYHLAATPSDPNWPAGLQRPFPTYSAEASDGGVGTPAIVALDGVVVVPVKDTLRAYDYKTGKPVPDWTFNWKSPNLHPISTAFNSMALVGVDQIAVAEVSPPGLFASHVAQTPFAIALTPSSTYVLARDGLYRFDNGMHQQDFTPFDASLGGSLMIDRFGGIVVALRSGHLLIFAGPGRPFCFWCAMRAP